MERQNIIMGFKKESLVGLKHLRGMEESLCSLIDLLKNTPDWQKDDLRGCLKSLFMAFRENQYDLERFFCLWVNEKLQ